MSTRAVSFVDRIEVDFTGMILSHAITLGDANNDGDNELVIGSTSGQLVVLRGTRAKPWKSCHDLGMISCVRVGDVCNRRKNYIVCLTGEGNCHLFHLQKTSGRSMSMSPRESLLEDRPAVDTEFKPVFTQRLHGNARRLLIVDADNDGQNELLVAHTDRHIRMYRWMDGVEVLDQGTQGQLHEVNTWQIAGQIGSLTVHVNSEGKNEILVSQPGGTYVTLIQHQNRTESEGPFLKFHPCNHTTLRNLNVCTMVVGNIRHNDAINHVIGVQDGSLWMMDGHEVKWTFERDQHFSFVRKLDFTGNGNDEVIVCTYDGSTYILDHLGTPITFKLDETVAAFCSGRYAPYPGQNVTCLIYVTYQHKIYIYYNVKLPANHEIALPSGDVKLPGQDVKPPSLSLVELVRESQAFQGLMSTIGLEDQLKERDLRDVIRWSLYGQKPRTEPQPPS